MVEEEVEKVKQIALCSVEVAGVEGVVAKPNRMMSNSKDIQGPITMEDGDVEVCVFRDQLGKVELKLMNSFYPGGLW